MVNYKRRKKEITKNRKMALNGFCKKSLLNNRKTKIQSQNVYNKMKGTPICKPKLAKQGPNKHTNDKMMDQLHL